MSYYIMNNLYCYWTLCDAIDTCIIKNMKRPSSIYGSTYQVDTRFMDLLHHAIHEHDILISTPDKYKLGDAMHKFLDSLCGRTTYSLPHWGIQQMQVKEGTLRGIADKLLEPEKPYMYLPLHEPQWYIRPIVLVLFLMIISMLTYIFGL